MNSESVTTAVEPVAEFARNGLVACGRVRAEMSSQCWFEREAFVAYCARKGSLSCMCANMAEKIRLFSENVKSNGCWSPYGSGKTQCKTNTWNSFCTLCTLWDFFASYPQTGLVILPAQMVLQQIQAIPLPQGLLQLSKQRYYKYSFSAFQDGCSYVAQWSDCIAALHDANRAESRRISSRKCRTRNV